MSPAVYVLVTKIIVMALGLATGIIAFFRIMIWIEETYSFKVSLIVLLMLVIAGWSAVGVFGVDWSR